MAAVSSEEFMADCLQQHNRLREEHQSPPLQLVSDLCEQAQSWAEKVAQRGHLCFAEIPSIGENITFFPESLSGTEVANYWAREREFYNFDKPGWQAGTNYFTQMVWKGSTELGVGRAPTPDRSQVVVVAFYKPPGNSNRAGEFAANVHPIQRPQE